MPQWKPRPDFSLKNRRISLIIPFYNEENIVRNTVETILSTFKKTGLLFELICVQNGSRDKTGVILENLAQKNKEMRVIVVPFNRGYGYGIRQGMLSAQGEIIGYQDGDGQIPPEHSLAVLRHMESECVAKAYRVIRKDGFARVIISAIFNIFFFSLFGKAPKDINAKPKFLMKKDLLKMDLRSDDWFIDAEIILKAKHLGIRFKDEAIKFEKRGGGSSSVRLKTLYEFIKNLLIWRFGKKFSSWKDSLN